MVLVAGNGDRLPHAKTPRQLATLLKNVIRTECRRINDQVSAKKLGYGHLSLNSDKAWGEAIALSARKHP